LKAGESDDADSEECKSIWELLAAMDSYIPLPQRDVDKDFLMPIEDVFTISGRGTVVTGEWSGEGKGWGGDGGGWDSADGEAGGDWGGDVPEALGLWGAGTTLGFCCGDGAQGRGAGAGGGEAGVDHAAQEVQGEVYV